MENFYVYKLTHPETNQFYYGSRVCSCDIEKDNYMGSMSGWKISKNEKRNLIKEIIKSDFNNVKDMLKFEANIIREHINDELNENYVITSLSFHAYNKVTVKTDSGKIILVSKDDPDYINGKLKFMHTGKVTVRDGDVIKMVDINDPDYLSGKLKFMHCGFVNVIDSKGNHFKISKDDPKYLSGELKSSAKDTVLVKDKNGNKMRVSIKDERYINGELKFIASGKALVKDKNGKKFYVDINDPRYLSGELVGASKGYWSHATHLIINNEFNKALYFANKYKVRIKDLQEYLDNNHIKYIKISKKEYTKNNF